MIWWNKLCLALNQKHASKRRHSLGQTEIIIYIYSYRKVVPHKYIFLYQKSFPNNGQIFEYFMTVNNMNVPLYSSFSIW